MSANYITVKQLIDRLSELDKSMLVSTIWPGDEDEWECEGSLEGASMLEVIKAHEVRSGWVLYDPFWHENDSFTEMLMISGVGSQWVTRDEEDMPVKWCSTFDIIAGK